MMLADKNKPFKTPKTTRYRIGNHMEECQCYWCGYPMYVGESAIETNEGAEVFCSQRCADNWHFCKWRKHLGMAHVKG